ncbi:MAG: hypothetical protein JW909_00625, partial [Planctomycetes bacterium]|nr:hypothetical protein [Planctomycetota bacterium]
MLRYVPILVTVVIWSWSDVFIKHLQTAGFDSFSQNFYRYAVSAVVMLVIAALTDRQGLRKTFSSPAFIVAGLFCAAYQTSAVLGLYYVFPAFSALI